MKILCIGPIWRGSNAGGLFRALSRNGHAIEVLDEFYYLPLKAQQWPAKLVAKLARKWFIADFNQAIINKAEYFTPDLCLVYKGAFVLSDTVHTLQQSGIAIVNLYPDVSFHTHGNLLQQTLPLYDFVFTTKTFGIADMKAQLGITASAFISHGYDPEIHRPIPLAAIPSAFHCDVSFIGTWSPKKEHLLAELIRLVPNIQLKIWGSQWGKVQSPKLSPFIMGREVTGDLYAAAINASKINLGLLSEKVKGASSGDLITSRTFHIPGAGGFLLHERNKESTLYFREGEEAAFFENPNQLAQQVEYYLEHQNERQHIAQAGHHRALREYALDNRATLLLQKLKEQQII